MDPRCAELYFQYGSVLLEESVETSDIFGNAVRRAAERKRELEAQQQDSSTTGEQEAMDVEPQQPEDQMDVEAAPQDATNSVSELADNSEASEAKSSKQEASEDIKQETQAEMPEDIQVAWELLETARVVLEKSHNADYNLVVSVHQRLADLHMELGKSIEYRF